MSKGENLGEFEQLVLLAVLSLSGPDAYGMNVRAVLRDRAGRDVSVPTVYSALDRLRGKGYVTTSMGEPTPERGGRATKLFEVTPAGIEAVRDARQALDRMWEAAALEPGVS